MFTYNTDLYLVLHFLLMQGVIGGTIILASSSSEESLYRAS